MKKLFIDDIREPHVVYPDEPTGWTVVRSIDDAMIALIYHPWDVISFDHDMGERTEAPRNGYDLMEWLLAKIRIGTTVSPGEVRIHTSNTSAKPKMQAVARDLCPNK